MYTATPPWFDSEIKHLLKRKETARRRAKRTNLPAHAAIYSNLRRECKRLIDVKHKSYVKELCEQVHDNPKRFWSYFRARSKTNSVPDTVNLNGKQYTTPEEKAEAFNQFFYSTFTPDDGTTPPLEALGRTTCNETSLDNICLSCDEVAKALANLDPQKARGPDNIPTLVLKKCAVELAQSLCILYNKSLILGRLPDEWKKSNVVPVHKKQRKDMVENYRPISLLCIVSKVLERCIFNRTMEHLSNFLSACQHGFMPGRSTVTQLLGFVHKIGSALDNGQQSDVIYLDFAKAFDSVCHSRLIYKLHHYGIRGQILKWYENYLSNRVQYTVLQGVTSAPLPVTSGVPQGSILGPLLFLVYINDLPEVIDSASNIKLFADDSKCHRTIVQNSDCLALQEDIDTLFHWSKDWRLRFNVKKCEVLSVTRKQRPIVNNYLLDGHPIKRANQQSDLGVIISHDLKWHEHIHHVLSKGYRMLGFLRRNAKNFDVRAKRTLYNTLVRSHVGYASQVWAPSMVGDIKSVENLQRRSTRFILPNSALNYRERLLKLNLLPVSYWHEINDLVFYFKCSKGLYHFSTDDYVKPKPVSRFTRNSHNMDLLVPLTKTKLFQNSYFNRLPKLWNSLPSYIRTLNNVTKFKCAVQNQYFDALKKSFCPDNYNSWKTICPKCCSTNNISNISKCCY